jgi:general secretion pathway protein F
MPRFHYTAVTAAGARVSGELEAATPADAVAALQRAGHFPLSTAPAAASLLDRLAGALRRKRPAGPALAVATHELAALLAAGLPLDRALEIVVSIAPDRRLAAAFAGVRERVRGGAGLAGALAGEPDTFPRLYVGLVQAGEAAGGLDATLARLADYLQRAQVVREQVRSALVYPIILLATAGVTLSFVLTRVLPQFKPLFAEAGQSLPLATRLVMALADAVSDWGWALVLLGLAAWLGLRRALARPGFRLGWDRRVLRLPILGKLVAEIEAARFARTLGTLVQGGLALPAALAWSRGTIGNRAMADAVGRAATDLRAGESLGDLMARAGLFPDLASQLIRVGEATGRLDQMLLHQAALFERSVARTTERLLAALVPGLTIGLGLLVAGIVGSVLAAIMKMNDLAG